MRMQASLAGWIRFNVNHERFHNLPVGAISNYFSFFNVFYLYAFNMYIEFYIIECMKHLHMSQYVLRSTLCRYRCMDSSAAKAGGQDKAARSAAAVRPRLTLPIVSP